MKDPFKPPYKNVFITVGTTKFESLMKTLDSELFYATIKSLGCEKLVIQKGSGEFTPSHLLSKQSPSFAIDIFDLKPSLNTYLKDADLIISHCGAGTISEVLAMNKPLVVVINETLMNNHQSELAKAFSENGNLVAATCKNLIENLKKLPSTTFVPVSPPKTSRFGTYLLNLMCE